MTTPDVAAEVIALERGALDRWGQGDPSAYLALFTSEITYFDPVQEHRVDGVAAMRTLFAPIAGKIRVDRYEMVAPAVQQHGDVALLSFNLLSYRTDHGRERVISRWNSTEAYRRTAAGWRIFHSHWSCIRPDLKESVSEEW